MKRAETWFNTRDCAILTAWRGGKSRKTNDDNNRKLQRRLRELGYGVTKITGWFAEKDKEVARENSFLTVNLNEEDSFRSNIYELSELYEQDSFLYKKAGRDIPAELVHTNDDTGKGTEELAGRLRIGIMEADIYYALSTGYAGILGSLASYIEKKPYILSEHGIYTREREEDIIRADWVGSGFKELWINFFKKMSRIAYKQANIVTSLFFVNKTLQEELGCPEEKIRLIPNGVATEEYDNLFSLNKLDKRHFNIATVLRVVPIKDVKTMLLAFQYVHEKLPNAQLSILGGYDESPEYYNECLELIHILHIENVKFYGQVNVKEFMPDIDLLLLSSISEGQPLAILEGMAAGIPIVSTNVGDCKSLLEGNDGAELGKAGCIVPVMDSKAMAKEIINLANHPEKRKKMGETGKSRVAKYYNKDSFLKQYHDLYYTLGGQDYGGYRI